MTARPASWASDPARSRGRLHPEPESRGERDAFQRDRDRIVHSTGFRRLRDKTQVFVAPDGDHFRVRLTHSLEVAQIGRSIARTLGLNEDLTEAVCLAHDIGHPPFGHAGEDALKDRLRDAGGFDHNGHTLRVLTRLERAYPHWPGLNLGWETLEGLAKHNGPVASPGWALAEADMDMPLDLHAWPSLEAQVAAIADDIAYDNHDIDDGLRAGILPFDALMAEPMLAMAWDAVCARLPGVPEALRRRELIRDQIGAMVGDVIAESRARIKAAGISSAEEARAAGPLVGFSDAMAADERRLKRVMYDALYHSPQQREVARAARRVTAALFDAYAGEPGLLPEGWREDMPDEPVTRARHVADFVAGMTDRYAIARHQALIGPARLPPGF